MNFYYLHIHAGEINRLETGHYSVQTLPTDGLFQSDGFWAKPDFFEHISNSKNKVRYEIVKNLLYSEEENSKFGELPTLLIKLDFTGTPGKDDFGVFNKKYLIVSEKGLDKMRRFGVVKAEHDLIRIPIDKYFSENHQYFWMPEPLRSMFIKRFSNTNHGDATQ